jgi:hypothetical protein
MNASTRQLLARHTFPKPTALLSFRQDDGGAVGLERERGNDSIIDAANHSLL